MSRFLIVAGILLLVIGLAWPGLAKLGLGRLPGDIDIQRNGRQYSFPIGSTVLLSLLASLIFWMLR